jgi:putative peptidoglycan lipid II flippase
MVDPGRDNLATRPMNRLDPRTIGPRLRQTLRHDSTTVFVATVLASIVALARDVIVGRSLGLGFGLDAWTVALAMVGFATSAVITAASASILPQVRRSRIGEGDYSPAEISAGGLAAALGVALALGTVTWLAAEPLASLATNTADTQMTTVFLVRALAVTAILSLLVRGIAGAILQSVQHFAMPALGPSISAIVVVLAVTVFDVTDVRRLVWYHGVGLIGEAGLLFGLVVRSTGLHAHDFRRSLEVSRVLSVGVGPAFVSAVAFSINPLIDVAFAANLGNGQAGRLGLASRLTIATAAVLASSLAVPAFPRFVDALTAGGLGALRRRFRRTLVQGILAGAGLTAVLGITTIPLARLLFAGSELSTSDARSVAFLQLTYSATAAPYIAAAISLRALYALGRNRAAMYIAIAGCVLNAVFNLALTNAVGIHGIAIATAAMYCLVSFAMSWCVLSPRGGVFESKVSQMRTDVESVPE